MSNLTIHRGSIGSAGPEKRWAVLAPPRLTLRELARDLRSLWTREFSGEPVHRKLVFSLLRIIQQVAYRRGYGNERAPVIIPPPSHPDFSAMEQNIEGLPKEIRLTWSCRFLEAMNVDEQSGSIPRPKSVIFELVNTCNYNCLDCGVGAGGIDTSRFMEVENLSRWAYSCCQDAELIRINGLGEATLHPQLDECLDILSRFPGGREIITNGSADIHVYERLLREGFVILVSWDGCTKSTFESIRRGADFSALCRMLSVITERAEHRGAPDPVLLFTLRPSNMNELPGTVLLGANRGIRRIIVNVLRLPDGSDWTADCREDIQRAFADAEDAATKQGVGLILPNHLGEEPIGLSDSDSPWPDHCPFPHSQVVIRCNGNVTPCNMMNPYAYGSLVNRTFDDCWNGAEARVFRDLRDPENRHPYCRSCHYVDASRRQTPCTYTVG